MTNPRDIYQKIVEMGKQIYTLQSLSLFVEWDQETFMPSGAVEFRSLQKQTLEGLAHQHLTATSFQELLSSLIDFSTGKLLKEEGLDDEQKAAIREFRKDVIKANKLPEEFVKKLARMGSETVSVWAETKPNSDFETFSKRLETFITVVKQKAEYLGYEDHPYDALLGEFEPGMTVKTLDPLFDRLKSFLIPFAKKVRTKGLNTDFMYGDFDESKVYKFDKKLLLSMGFDESTFRLDSSNHPFCLSFHPTDVRMTTVSKTNDLIAANISATIHEGGHGLYEAGLNKEHFGTPMCQAVSIAMHESQSKIWECFIGQSKPFWQHFYPQLQTLFPDNFENQSLDQFYLAMNRVEPSLIRIYSDEVHYCLHVILRYEIEKGLIEGSIDVQQIPEIWNEKMDEYIGIRPKNHAEGCMQDIHWAWGLFGYFPTYALGNLYAAQLFDKLKTTFPDYQERLSQGHLTFVTDWLRENVHRFGRQFSSEELLTKCTGTGVSASYFEKYLEEKYT